MDSTSESESDVEQLTEENVNIHHTSTGSQVLEAVSNNDENSLRRLLDEPGALGARTSDGQTALHLAVMNDNHSIVQLLIEKGADIEAADDWGNRPLYIAAESGNLALVQLLLRFKPDVESFNWEAESTAFSQAVANGHTSVAKVLLANGADIDRLVRDRQTPLFSAVIRDNLDTARFLLQNGANTKVRDDLGRRVENFASEGTPMMDLLQSDQLLQGPSITEPAAAPEVRVTTPRLGADQIDKLHACRGFEGTIVDFFVGDTEQRIQKTESVYEILYGKGPDSIMNLAKGAKMAEKRHNFRWYHLPANNMEWVDILLTRHFEDQHQSAVMLDEEFKSQLALSISAGQRYRGSTNFSSFMHPQCRAVKWGSESSSDDTEANNAVLFIPFLHFETHNSFQKMSQFLASHREINVSESQPVVKKEPVRSQKRKSKRRSSAAPPPPPPPPVVVTAASDTSSEDEISKGSVFKRLIRAGDNFIPFYKNLRSTVRQGSGRLVRAMNLSSNNQQDLEKGSASEDVTDGPSSTNVDPEKGALSGPKSDEPTSVHAISEGPQEQSEDAELTKNEDREENTLIMLDPTKPAPAGSSKGENISERLPIPQPRQLHDASSQEIEVAPKTIIRSDEESKLNESTDAAGGGNQPGKPASSGPSIETPTKPNTVPEERHATVPSMVHETETASKSNKLPGTKPQIEPPGIPDEHLVKGYLSRNNFGDSPLQLRRTLDQYFYAYLANTSDRDNGGQVVYRYTNRTSSEPKMFMVDQLWLWIVQDDTLISCCPQRWDILSGPTPQADPPFRPLPEEWSMLVKPPRLPQPPSQGAHELSSQSKSAEKSKSEGGRMLGWVAGKPSKRRKGEMQQRSRDPEISGPGVPNLRIVEPADSRPSTADERRKHIAFLQKDPLNVHQIILKHLQSRLRDPVTSTYDLAYLITDTCISLFDRLRAPDEFQFLDFFEKSIGAVVDQEARCFQNFATRIANTKPGGADESDAVFSIAEETKLLAEIKDIIDELGILKMVLSDQRGPSEEFIRIVKKGSKSEKADKDSLPATFAVLENHLRRLERMESLAKTTYDAIFDLLNLKQMQANVSQAHFGRKQADNTYRQADEAKKLSEQSLDQARIAADQTQETVRQGRTVLVFTVVTIIFLPLSFMAAFFAINIDAFPWTSDGRLPLDYVLKYLLSISASMSIPLVLIALNQDRIAKWLKNYGSPKFAIWGCVVAALAILIPVIWTSDLARGIKAAVTIVVILILIVGLIWRLLNQMFNGNHDYAADTDEDD